jgi:hypothetical protein
MAALEPEEQRVSNSQAESKEISEVSLTTQQQADLTDSDTQARYLAEFNEQLRRRFCPGCGDS